MYHRFLLNVDNQFIPDRIIGVNALPVFTGFDVNNRFLPDA